MSDILSTHPDRDTFDLDPLRRAINAALACASTCATCADACRSGDDPAAMSRCSHMCEQCSTMCFATARILSQPAPNGEGWRQIVKACIAVCRECAEECSSHDMDHCQMCAETCRECADACQALLDVAS